MFRDNFLLGASLSGFQFEMGGNVVDKKTDWYVWAKNDLNAFSGMLSGDDPECGPDYWESYQRFHQLAVKAGMNALRIGIEWSRIFPEKTYGFTGEKLSEIANYEAIKHYKKIMKDIKEKGMKLMVNLNHFTLPLWAHDPLAVNRKMDFTASGWADSAIVQEFSKYASFVVEQFDDLVDYWSTLNEPNVVANLGYLNNNSGFPPSIIAPDLWSKAMNNQIDAHIKAYNAMKRKTDKPVGLIYATIWFDGDDTAAEAFKFNNYYFLDSVNEYCDFLGINYYTRTVVKKRNEPIKIGNVEIRWDSLPGYGYSCQPNGFSRDGRIATDNGWEIYPKGLEKIIINLNERYNKKLFITENGVADSLDRCRTYYLLTHLDVVEKLADKCNIEGYFHWSLTDNFEWPEGYSKRFGLVYVDFENKRFIPRPSYYVFKEIANNKSIIQFKGLLDLFKRKNINNK
jgi:beta-glucosidase/6-phospho-beta-glucosidase/beta-galactosidase